MSIKSSHKKKRKSKENNQTNNAGHTLWDWTNVMLAVIVSFPVATSDEA
jgi:hypothetical protein